MKENELSAILDSYINGQISQMVAQIKAYGQKDFFVDFYKWNYGAQAKIQYAIITYTFFLVK